MIPAPFDYVRAGSADEAIAALAEHGDDAKLLAGGMSLLPLMKLRLATPTVLVDVGRVRELSYIRDADDHLAVGALTRHRDLETSDAARRRSATPLRAVASEVGDNQVRHRGTIGGSVAHGDPASDLPALLLALDATFVGARSRAASARSPRADFFHGLPRDRASRPTSCSPRSACPSSAGVGFSYQKFKRRAQDWAIVGAMAVRNGDTRVALVNMGGTPLRALAVEEALAGGASVERGRRACRRGHRAARRHQRNARVPRAPRTRARAARARSRVGLTQPDVAIAVLAAGRGSRLGGDVPKPLVELRGRPLVSWALDAATGSGLRPVVLVVGHHGDAVARVAPEGVVVVRSHRWRRGIARSLRAALEALGAMGSGGSGLRRPRRPAARRRGCATAGWPTRTETAQAWRWRRTTGSARNPVLLGGRCGRRRGSSTATRVRAC